MMNKEFVKNYCDKFEESFNIFLPKKECSYSTVTEAMRYSFLLGGKRVRPCILMEFYKICGGKEDYALPFAVALEMIHTYSLIHDDLPCMDDDDIRRGKPSNHIVYGEDMALLAGDGLLTHAFFVASSTENIEPALCLKALRELAHLAGFEGMIGGQVIDLQSEDKDVPAETIFEINSLKTGALIRCAMLLGYFAACDAPEDEIISDIEGYATNLGVAFQVRDDILDKISDTATLGKPVGSDDKNGKTTSLTFMSVDEAQGLVNKYTEEAISLIEKYYIDKNGLCSLIELASYMVGRSY